MPSPASKVRGKEAKAAEQLGKFLAVASDAKKDWDGIGGFFASHKLTIPEAELAEFLGKARKTMAKTEAVAKAAAELDAFYDSSGYPPPSALGRMIMLADISVDVSKEAFAIFEKAGQLPPDNTENAAAADENESEGAPASDTESGGAAAAFDVRGMSHEAAAKTLAGLSGAADETSTHKYAHGMHFAAGLAMATASGKMFIAPTAYPPEWENHSLTREGALEATEREFNTAKIIRRQPALLPGAKFDERRRVKAADLRRWREELHKRERHLREEYRREHGLKKLPSIDRVGFRPLAKLMFDSPGDEGWTGQFPLFDFEFLLSYFDGEDVMLSRNIVRHGKFEKKVTPADAGKNEALVVSSASGKTAILMASWAQNPDVAIEISADGEDLGAGAHDFGALKLFEPSGAWEEFLAAGREHWKAVAAVEKMSARLDEKKGETDAARSDSVVHHPSRKRNKRLRELEAELEKLESEFQPVWEKHEESEKQLEALYDKAAAAIAEDAPPPSDVGGGASPAATPGGGAVVFDLRGLGHEGSAKALAKMMEVTTAKGHRELYHGVNLALGVATATDGHRMYLAPAAYPADWEKSLMYRSGSLLMDNSGEHFFMRARIMPPFWPHTKFDEQRRLSAEDVKRMLADMQAAQMKIRKEVQQEKGLKSLPSARRAMEGKSARLVFNSSGDSGITAHFDAHILEDALRFMKGGGAVMMSRNTLRRGTKGERVHPDDKKKVPSILMSAEDGRTAIFMPYYADENDTWFDVAAGGVDAGAGQHDFGALDLFPTPALKDYVAAERDIAAAKEKLAAAEGRKQRKEAAEELSDAESRSKAALSKAVSDDSVWPPAGTSASEGTTAAATPAAQPTATPAAPAEEAAPASPPGMSAAARAEALKEMRRLESGLRRRVLGARRGGGSGKKTGAKKGGGGGEKQERQSALEKLRVLSAQTGQPISLLANLVGEAGGNIRALRRHKPIEAAAALAAGLENLKPPAISFAPVSDWLKDNGLQILRDSDLGERLLEDGRGELSADLFGSEDDGALDDLSGVVKGDSGWGAGRFDNMDLDSSGMVTADAVERALLAEKDGAGGHWNGEERKALQEFAEWRDLLGEIQEGLTKAGIDPRAAANREVSSEGDWQRVLVEVERVMNEIGGDGEEDSAAAAQESVLDDVLGESTAEEDADAVAAAEEESPQENINPNAAKGDVDASLALLPEGAQRLVEHLDGGGRLASKREVLDMLDEGANFPEDYQGDVYKWMGEQVEAAMNFIVLRDGMSSVEDAAALYGRLAKTLLSGKRSAQVDEKQQFSTPLPLAAGAALASGMREGERALEPSAGNGGLAVFLRPSDVWVNEIDEGRLDILRNLGDGFGGWRGMTAMQAHREMRNYFDEEPVDVVIMNPPFSHSQGRKKGSEVTDEHVAAAFSNARLGARAVVITGHNWTPTAATHRRAFDVLAKKGWRRRGSIQLPGELYAAYGASFPVRLTVFDNLGPDAPAVEGVFEEEVENWEEFAEAVRQIPARPAAMSPPPDSSGEGDGDSDIAEETSTNIAAGGARGLLPTAAEIAAAEESAPAAEEEASSAQVRRPPPAEATGAETGGDIIDGAALVSPAALQADTTDAAEARWARMQREGVLPIPLAAGTTAAHADVNRPGHVVWQPTIDGLPSGVILTTSKALGETSKPSLRNGMRFADGSPVLDESAYPAGFPGPTSEQEELMHRTFDAWEEFYRAEGISDAQRQAALVKMTRVRAMLDAETNPVRRERLEKEYQRITLAVEAQREALRGKVYRAGAMWAMGTGVGKTLIGAGAVLGGRKLGYGGGRAVVFSVKPELIGWLDEDGNPADGFWEAAHQLGMDWRTIYSGANAVKSDLPFRENSTLFFGYTALGHRDDPKKSYVVSGGDINNRALAYLFRQLSADYDGIIVLDEAHLLANATPADIRAKGSGRGSAVMFLQEMFPQARIMYLSATPFKSTQAFNYVQRLGLVGEDSDSPFDTIDNMRMWAQATPGAAEALTPELKGMGRFDQAAMSYLGVDFDMPVVPLTADQKKAVLVSRKLWNYIYHKAEESLSGQESVVGGGDEESGRLFGAMNSGLTTGMKRYWSMLNAGFMAPEIGRRAAKLISEGEFVEVQANATYDAALDREIKRQEAAQGVPHSSRDFNWDAVDVTPLMLVRDAIMTAWDVNAYERHTKENDEGEERTTLIPILRRGKGGEEKIYARMVTRGKQTIPVYYEGEKEVEDAPLGKWEVAEPRDKKRGAMGLIVKSLDPASVEARNKVMEKAERELSGMMPENPFDTILAEVVRVHGADIVGESSGRTYRRDFSREDWEDNYRLVKVGNHQPLTARAKAGWHNGDIRFVIWSEAVGGTGVNWHLRRTNPRAKKPDGTSARVHHFILTLGEQADMTMQGLGRSHRKFQEQPPFYHLMRTDAYASFFQLMPVAGKLSMLGANSTASRKGMSGGVDFSQFDMMDDYFALGIRSLALQLDRASRDPTRSAADEGLPEITPHELFVRQMRLESEFALMKKTGGGWESFAVKPQRFINRIQMADLSDAQMQALFEAVKRNREDAIEEAGEDAFNTTMSLRAGARGVKSIKVVRRIGLRPPTRQGKDGDAELIEAEIVVKRTPAEIPQAARLYRNKARGTLSYLMPYADKVIQIRPYARYVKSEKDFSWAGWEKAHHDNGEPDGVAAYDWDKEILSGREGKGRQYFLSGRRLVLEQRLQVNTAGQWVVEPTDGNGKFVGVRLHPKHLNTAEGKKGLTDFLAEFSSDKKVAAATKAKDTPASIAGKVRGGATMAFGSGMKARISLIDGRKRLEAWGRGANSWTQQLMLLGMRKVKRNGQDSFLAQDNERALKGLVAMDNARIFGGMSADGEGEGDGLMSLPGGEWRGDLSLRRPVVRHDNEDGRMYEAAGVPLRESRGDPHFGLLRRMFGRGEELDLFSAAGRAVMGRASLMSPAVFRSAMADVFAGGEKEYFAGADWRALLEALGGDAAVKAAAAGKQDSPFSAAGKRRAASRAARRLAGRLGEGGVEMRVRERLPFGGAGMYMPGQGIMSLAMRAGGMERTPSQVMAATTHETSHAIAGGGGGAELFAALSGEKRAELEALIPKWAASNARLLDGRRIGEAADQSIAAFRQMREAAGRPATDAEVEKFRRSEVFAYAMQAIFEMKDLQARAAAQGRKAIREAGRQLRDFQLPGRRVLESLWRALADFGRALWELGVRHPWQAGAVFDFVFRGAAKAESEAAADVREGLGDSLSSLVPPKAEGLPPDVVRGEDGQPLKMLHGTPAEFDKYKRGRDDAGRPDLGVHFTPDNETALRAVARQDEMRGESAASPKIRTAFLRGRVFYSEDARDWTDPERVYLGLKAGEGGGDADTGILPFPQSLADQFEGDGHSIEDMRRALMSHGVDILAYPNESEGEGEFSYVALHPGAIIDGEGNTLGEDDALFALSPGEPVNVRFNINETKRAKGARYTIRRGDNLRAKTPEDNIALATEEAAIVYEKQVIPPAAFRHVRNTRERDISAALGGRRVEISGLVVKKKIGYLPFGDDKGESLPFFFVDNLSAAERKEYAAATKGNRPAGGALAKAIRAANIDSAPPSHIVFGKDGVFAAEYGKGKGKPAVTFRDDSELGHSEWSILVNGEDIGNINRPHDATHWAYRFYTHGYRRFRLFSGFSAELSPLAQYVADELAKRWGGGGNDLEAIAGEGSRAIRGEKEAVVREVDEIIDNYAPQPTMQMRRQFFEDKFGYPAHDDSEVREWWRNKGLYDYLAEDGADKQAADYGMPRIPGL